MNSLSLFMRFYEFEGILDENLAFFVVAKN